jgi:hypothetical protein
MDARIEHEFRSIVDNLYAEVPPTYKVEGAWSLQAREDWRPWFETFWALYLMSYSNWLLR